MPKTNKTKRRSVLTKKNRVIAIICFGLSLVLLFLVLPKQSKVSNTPILPPLPSAVNISQNEKLKEIEPGKTSNEQVIERLGKPINTREEEEYTIFEYESSIPTYNHELYTKNNIVHLIKERLDLRQGTKKILEYFSTTSSSPVIKHTEELSESIGVFIFAKHGVAFVAHTSDQTVYEIWRFIPTEIEEILKTWGNNLKDKEDLDAHF